VCLLAWITVKNDPVEKNFRSYAPSVLQRKEKTGISAIGAGFRRVFGYRNTWLIFFAQGSMVGSILSFTGLWERHS